MANDGTVAGLRDIVMANREEVDGTGAHLGRPAVFLVVLLTWAVIYLPGLGATEIRAEEGRRILPAVSMLQTGNWLVPHIGGQPYYQKPPVINWLVAGSFLLTGRQDEAAARLPTTLFVLAFVTLLVWFPGDWPRIEVRLIAAVLFLTTFAMMKKGRQIEIDGVYICLTAMALFTWVALWMRGTSRWALWLVPGIFVTLGLLTKGPPIFVFYYAPVLGVLAYSRRLRALLSVPHLAALVLSLGLPALWAYIVSRQAVTGAVLAGPSEEIVTRLTSLDDWGRWVSEVARSFLMLFPWIFFVPLLWRKDFVGHISPSHQPLFKGARLGLVVSFLAITLIPGNSGRYGMPALGLGCLLLGWVLGEVGELPDAGRLWRSAALAGSILAIPLAVVGLAAVRRDVWAVVFLGAVACLMPVLWRRRALFRTPPNLAMLSALLGAILTLEYVLFLTPVLQRSDVRRPIAAALTSLLPDSESLHVYQPGYLDLLFYVRRPVEYVLDPAQIDEHVHYFLVSESNYQRLQSQPAIAGRLGRTVYDFSYRHRGAYRLLERLPPEQQTQPCPETPGRQPASLAR
jgi:4-amino-4-deoxy-L-arabinose transferase-like glycosyltransferase